MKKLLLTIGCNLSWPRDAIAHLYYRFKYRKSWERAKFGAAQLRQWIKSKRDPEVDAELKRRFEWTQEVFDWRPLSLEMLHARSYLDDCDGFGQLCHFIYRDGRGIVIWPNKGNYNAKGEPSGFHMIYERAGKIYSSGNIHFVSLNQFIKDAYPEGAVWAVQWI
jgi:hypothetical protein